MVDKNIEVIDGQLDYLNEEFDIIRNGVGNIIRIQKEETQLKSHQKILRELHNDRYEEND